MLALPGPQPQTTISNGTFRDALWLRIGLSAPVGHEECAVASRDDLLGLHSASRPLATALTLRRTRHRERGARGRPTLLSD